jgi:serine/threonine protein kinase
MRELAVLSALDGVPGIVELVDHFEDKKTIYIVMEFISGGDLARMLQARPQQRLTEDEARPIFWQLLVTIQHLHNRGIVHRDIKPENIMLECVPGPYPIRTIVVDFGLAKVAEAAHMHATVAGTPSYMAPEVQDASAHGYTAIVDMWSMGAILYQMLRGRPPFSVGSTSRVVAFDDDDDGVWATLRDPAVIDLIRQLMAIDPNERLDANRAIHHPWLNDPDLHKAFPPDRSMVH